MPAVSPAIYLSKELYDFLNGLDDDHKFRKWINDMKLVLKENKFAGDLIEKKKIPRHYIQRFNVHVLYRYRLPEGYRSCYTILEKCPHILDVISHPEYERIFGYKK